MCKEKTKCVSRSHFCYKRSSKARIWRFSLLTLRLCCSLGVKLSFLLRNFSKRYNTISFTTSNVFQLDYAAIKSQKLFCIQSTNFWD